MLSLNYIVRAVIIHEGKFLVTCLDDGVREPFFTFLGGHVALGETVTEAVAREAGEETGIKIAPSKLLYIGENFFLRGRSKLHELGFYFLCHPIEPVEGGMIEAISPTLGQGINPKLLSPAELVELNFQPAKLARIVVNDLKHNFSDSPKLVVINELPGDATAKGGVFTL